MTGRESWATTAVGRLHRIDEVHHGRRMLPPTAWRGQPARSNFRWLISRRCHR